MRARADSPCILGFDTATAACTVALARGTSTASIHRVVDRRHNDILLANIDELTGGGRDLDFVAFGQGPGSFTGVRIAASVAQGIALARELPVVGISTLATLARGALRRHPDIDSVVACIGGRKGELYTCGYRRSRASECEPAAIAEEETVRVDVFAQRPFTQRTGVCGDATAAIAAAMNMQSMNLVVLPWQYPHAEDLLELARAAIARGDIGDVTDALPVYLEGSGSWQKFPGR